MNALKPDAERRVFPLGTAYLPPRLHIIQYLIRQQRAQLNQLLNPQRQMTPRAFQVERQITHHRISRSQRLDRKSVV